MIGVRSSGMQDLAALAVAIPKVATAVSIPLQIFWAGKILRFGLTSRYRALLAYLVIIPLFSTAFLAGIYWLDPDTRSFRLFYGWLFAVFAPVNAILLFCVLVETARAMFLDDKSSSLLRALAGDLSFGFRSFFEVSLTLVIFEAHRLIMPRPKWP